MVLEEWVQTGSNNIFPQGSFLRPLLLLIYVDDLPSVSKVLSFYLFAGDTNVYFKSSDIVHLKKVMNRELRKVRKWLDEIVWH